MRGARALATLTLPLLLAAAGPLRAECECLWQGSFTDVQADTDLVVSATVITQKGNSIDLQVDQLLRGNEPPLPPRVWLKTADYCRPEVETFPVGSAWVMALYRIEEQVPGGFNPATPNISYGRVGDYQLSSCGGYWLQRRGAAVSGNLVDAPRWDMNPKMNPVLLELVTGFVRGEVSAGTLLKASEEDPELKKLRLDTKAFLRNGD